VYQGGTYVGLGEGDRSPEIAKAKAKLKAKFTPARNTLDDSDYWEKSTPEKMSAMTAEVIRVQDVYRSQNRPGAPRYVRGVINLEFKYDLGILERPRPNLPIQFTLEGHLSNMFIGPCAQTAGRVEQEGLAHWKPVGDWDTGAIPFKNNTGVEALYRQLSRHWVEGPPVDPNQPDGPKTMWWFGPEVPWSLIGFSQGAMIACEFMWKYVLPPNAPLHYRLKTFKRGLMFGNPRRNKDAICSWAQSPPSEGTSGIMTNRLFDADKEGVGDRWAENANDSDMFAEVGDDEMSQNQTAIARIICEGSFTGGPTSIWARVMKVFGNPLGGTFNIIKSIYDAIMFLAANPNPHYSTFATPGDIEWARGVAR
jgi:hypothetical protein